MSRPTPPPPPNLPEMDDERTQPNPVLRPDMDDTAFFSTSPDDDYIEIEIPSQAAQRTPIQPDDSASGGLNGCLYGLGGAFGCMTLVAILLISGLFLAGRELTQAVGDFANYFDVDLVWVDWDDRADVEFDPNTYVPPVEPIQNLAELVTTRYNYSQIVTGQSDMPAALAALYGEELVLVAVGHIEAGIDVSQITQEDVVYDATTQTLTVNLPSPRLRACFLDESRSYIAERRSGIFAQTNRSLEESTREYALRQFRDDAIENGILEEAANEVLGVMQGFLGTTIPDGTTLNVQIATINFDAPLPDTCG